MQHKNKIRKAFSVNCKLSSVNCPAQAGVTLIDTVVGTALMLVVFLGIAAAFQLSVEVVTNNKARAGAIALANERMEYLRSLSYSQIGVIGGIPAGNVLQEETVAGNGLQYTRRTMVLYADDPQDGSGAADQNGIIADYKTIRVEIVWASRQGERSVTLVGRVSPAGIESAVPGGTLTISVVNAASATLSDAQVDIINTGVVPAINIRTYTNSNGTVTFIGAPAASDYQITVSKPGYSSAQTYPITAQNPDPNPRHLTVANNQTTSASFGIDYVSTKTVQTYMQVREGSWTDALSDATKIATSASTTIASGVARLVGSPGTYPALGSMQSVSIAPASLYGWKTFAAATTSPDQTNVVFRFYDGTGATLIPEGQLPGNAAGFATSSVDLSGISTSTYPQLRIGSTLASADPQETPSINSYTISYDYGPEPLPNLSFLMRGNKTIGNNPAVYKYEQTHDSGASAEITLSNIEWDSYTLSIPGSTYTLTESCNPQPESIAPATTQTTRLYVLPYSSHSLLIDVRSNTGALLEDALVQATSTGYDISTPTRACGQAYFGSLTNTSYAVTVSKSGYQTSASQSVNVNGATRLSVTLNSN